MEFGSWNEEDTDARREEKNEHLDVRAWREYHVRVLKGKLF